MPPLGIEDCPLSKALPIWQSAISATQISFAAPELHCTYREFESHHLRQSVATKRWLCAVG